MIRAQPAVKCNFHQNPVFNHANRRYNRAQRRFTDSSEVVFTLGSLVSIFECIAVCQIEPDKSKHVSEIMATVCKHPRVRVVSRHEDTEFVECLECGEVFDSEEFRDMEIEESVEAEEADTES